MTTPCGTNAHVCGLSHWLALITPRGSNRRKSKWRVPALPAWAEPPITKMAVCGATRVNLLCGGSANLSLPHKTWQYIAGLSICVQPYGPAHPSMPFLSQFRRFVNRGVLTVFPTCLLRLFLSRMQISRVSTGFPFGVILWPTSLSTLKACVHRV